MAIREINEDAPPTVATLYKRMYRIAFVHEGGVTKILASWKRQRLDGTEIDITVPVSDALRDQILSRPGVQSMVDQIRDDTNPKLPAAS